MLHRKGIDVDKKTSCYIQIYDVLIKKNFVSHEKYFDVVQKSKLVCINVINFAGTVRHMWVHMIIIKYNYLNIIHKSTLITYLIRHSDYDQNLSQIVLGNFVQWKKCKQKKKIIIAGE